MVTHVSVIVPVFGNRDLTNSLFSISNQTFIDFECIVVDDGSSTLDHLRHRAIVDSFDSRFSIQYYTSNKGASFARQYGINSSSGKLIAFLDSDDVWSHDYLSKVTILHKLYANFPIVSTSFTSSFSSFSSCPMAKSVALLSVFSLCFKPRFSCPASSIKREMMTTMFSSDLRYAEDLKFFFGNLLRSRKKLVFLDEPLVLLNRLPGSSGGLSHDRRLMYTSSALVSLSLASEAFRYYPFYFFLLLLRSMYCFLRSFLILFFV